MKLKFSAVPKKKNAWWVSYDVFQALRTAIANTPCGSEDDRRVLWRILDKFDAISKPVTDQLDARFPDMAFALNEKGGEIELDLLEIKAVKQAWTSLTPKLPAKYRAIIEAGDKLFVDEAK